MFILSFFACSPSIDTFGTESGDVFASSKEEPPGEPTPDTVKVVYDYTRPGFAEARPVSVEDGAFVCGPPLFLEEFDGEEMIIDLPPAPFSADGVPLDKPVVYAIAQRDPTDEGLPGLYTGMAAAQLVWLPGETVEGGSPGWNMALHYGSEDVEWMEVKAPALTSNLVGLESLTLAGTVETPAENLRLALGTVVDGEQVIMWDAPIGNDWYGTLPDVPPRETIYAAHGMRSAQFAGLAYIDEDEDGVHTDEPFVGRLSADGEPVMVAWVAPVTTFLDALYVRRNHARMGWTVYARTDEHMVPVNGDMTILVEDL